MKVLDDTLPLGRLANRLAFATSWLAAGLALLVILYFLSVPPIILNYVRQTASGSFPTVYHPILRIIESDYGGPLVWYFNRVWGAELVLIGDETSPPWYAVALYLLLGLAFLTVLALPFWRMRQRKRAALRIA
jgi:hypothetical protein